ncbi:DUF3237 domain-containing protein [Citricoccus alkalitolerans]|uniref:DUF3237 domain-containing protein n=1 Tax=Citricoccus alkalitolerans TaxID=246603 RepID=A0ABV8XTJ0_9MICC
MTQITSAPDGDAADAHGPTIGRGRPALRYSFSIRAEVDPHLPIVQRDAEALEFIPITGGPVRGELSGEIVPGGGDWCLARADRAYNLEARYGIRTDGGAYVDVVNLGVLRHLPGESGGPGEMGYFMTTPTFRTAEPALQWLTRSVFVGQAQSDGTATTIDVYEVLAGPC